MALSAAKAFKNLIEIGASIRFRTHMNSQGRVQTSPQIHGNGLSFLITSMASSSRPMPIRDIYVGTSIPAGQAVWHGAGASLMQSPLEQLWVSI
jgi:hypothetical protein